MRETSFRRQFVISCKTFAVRHSAPPLKLTAKPARMEKTMSGSIARRDKSAAKSSTVKKLTSSSAMLACASTVPAAASVHGALTGG